ncbi:curved DNA-binding protein [Methylomarinovum tepidoasis]|uniref:Curved DNA-binding protein n=1 Tax=Methylomarinovum tepidoasis TaxID=2840183 RepID=A0AAU9CCZ2_9GAMM|nr:DnaJ C-terminal domain-containing protein [Methylomarinovum sp. IN45]BCX89786.1 curved DNA-binding protein [Methylomarinovum sp. IN45]
MEYKDYYKILGVSRDATQDEIKRAYRKLARKYHPDVSKEADAEEKFKEVNEAYEVLKDPEKRKAYDQFGAHWKEGQGFQPPPGWEEQFGFGGGGYTEGGRTADFSEFFEALFGGGGFRRGRARSGFRMRGEDLHAKVYIDLEDAYRGTTQTLTLSVPEVDPATGRLVDKHKRLQVKIPKGIREGQKIRLAGQGAPGMGGGPAGDLYLEVHFKPHRWFKVEDKDVYLDLPVTPWEAALGAKVPVPTLEGKVELRIPPGSQTDRKLRLKGKGLPGTPAGDQYVILKIHTPPADTEDKKRFYEEMARKMPFNPRQGMGV